MGVPKFFRYISERYPCLSELIKDYQIPEFDNLYLDMNGIIHMCSHPDDYDPHFRISEEKIFSDIFHYIEVLFRMIKPQKLFFMAVDGVAPRAKMNQQRGRRFRSAKEAEALEAKATERGEALPEEARFDSNCITPGTVFMARLHEQLKYFVANKISSDKLWQKCKIILSGQETPGEGEHKIMDYIRYMKAQAGYDPNTRHCLYGLDADLIMLGLCTHEPHFSLLREEVRFGKKAKRKNIPEQISFYLLHLSLMREYLELEFLPLKKTLPFEYNMEKIIDDWVLMGFLVGNDFIPHLPNLHIANGALPILYNAYMKILPTLDGYINEFGKLHLERFEKFMSALAAIDMENFSEQFADLKYFESKTGRKFHNKDEKPWTLKNLKAWVEDGCDIDEPIETKPANKELMALIKSTDDLLLEDGFNGTTEDETRTEIKLLSNPELIVTAKLDDLLNLAETTDSNNASSSTDLDFTTQVDDLLCLPINGDSSTIITPENCNNLVDILNSKQNETVEQAVEATEELEKLEKPSKVLEPSSTNLLELAIDEITEIHEDDEASSPYYSSTDDTDENDLMNAEFIQHKNDYYMNKLDYIQVTPEVMRDQAEGYVRAIQWNLHYYYNGVCSWSWYYPHHYAPYISDIKGFTDLKLEYELGQPFQPFEQLLAVLPAASKILLPKPYQELMTSEDSSIIDFYPQDFRTDLNGKKQDWEAVVLIPFIDEDLLLKAMIPCNEKLTEEEKKRNTHGPMLVYEYTPDDLGAYEAPEYFPTIQCNHAKLLLMTIEDIRVPIEKLVKGLCPGAIHDIYYPGFPTMKHLKYTGHLEKAKVRVFDSPSLNDNMIVKIEPMDTEVNIEDLALEILGKSVYVSWPHLVEAIVVSVSDSQCRYHRTFEPGKFNLELNKGNLLHLWLAQKNGILNFSKEKFGIDVGEITILVHVKQLTGQKYSYTKEGLISLEKQWAGTETCYPIQAVIRNLVVYQPEGKKLKTVQDLFPVGSKCFMLGHPHYGSMGKVIDNTTLKSGRIKVNIQIYAEPDFTHIYQLEKEIKYMHGSIASKKLGISAHLLSRITGSIFIVPGVPGSSIPRNSSKINIGLNLKLNKKNEEIPGYTKKVDGQWLYSQKSVNLVRDYMESCSDLFTYITEHLGNDIFYESELFPNAIGEGKIQKIVEWIKLQPFSSIEPQKVGSEIIDQEIVKEIEEMVDNFNSNNMPEKSIIMQIKPHLLYKSEVQTGNLAPDNEATYQLYDRVVNIRESYTIPFGCKGTVIGIQGSNNVGNNGQNPDTIIDVVFDQAFPGGMQLNCSPNRGYRVPKTALINLSYGMRSLQHKTVNSVSSSTSWNNKHPSQQSSFLSNPSVQSQNSAFASWIPAYQNQSNNYNYRQQAPVSHQQQQRFIAPTQVNHPVHMQVYNHPMNHRLPATLPMNVQMQQRVQQPPIQRQILSQNRTPQHMQQQSHVKEQKIQQQSIANQQQIEQKQSIVNQQPMNQQISPEFLAFFQDLQKNQGNKIAANTASPLQVKQQSPVKSPQKAKKNPVEETEALKKLLNIAVKTSPVKSPPKDDSNLTQQISVQDLFTHARNKEQKIVQQTPSNKRTYTAELLHYCQSQGIGIPRYTYFTAGPKTRAQVTLQDGRMVIGDESSNNEDAAEIAAKIIITEMTQMKYFSPRNANSGSSKMHSVPASKPHSSPKAHSAQSKPTLLNDTGNPKILPVPPRQWYQNQKQSNMQKPTKHVNSNVLISPQRQQEPELQEPVKTPHNVQKPVPKTDENRPAVPFIPLQAVKQQRHKSISEINEEKEKKENKSMHNINREENSDAVKNKTVSSPKKQTQSTSSLAPKQKTRRSRIAANFNIIKQKQI